MTRETDGNKAGEIAGHKSRKKWERLQNLFSKISGIPIDFYSPSFDLQIRSNPASLDLKEMIVPLHGNALKDPVPALLNALKQSVAGGIQKIEYLGLSFLLLPLMFHERHYGTFVLGPVLIGRRESEAYYRGLCQKEEIQAENFYDHLREIRLYSHLGIAAISEFMEEMMGFLIEQDLEAREPAVIPAAGPGKKFGAVDSFLSMRFSNELSQSLLEMGLGLVRGSSGSVLVFEEKEKSFLMQASKGITIGVAKNFRIPEGNGVVGLVAQQKTPILIKNKEDASSRLRPYLNRSSLKASFVIPMTYEDKVLGVLCLNTETDNERFNPENLETLNQLAKIAGIALARLNQDE